MLTPSSNLPGRHGPGRPPSLFGLAPDGVCRACRVTTASGGLLPHRFTLTTHDVAVCFLWRCPRVAPPGYCPASCPAEPGLSSPDNGHAPLVRSDGLSDSRARPDLSEGRGRCARPATEPELRPESRREPRWQAPPLAAPRRNARTRKSDADSWGSSESADHAEGQ